MKGFRTTGSVRTTPASDPHCHTQADSGSPLVAQIVDELTHGKTTAMVAKSHGLPRDFVDMVLERAQRNGTIDFFEIKPGTCTKGACDPDPESLVCAGCPIMPAAVRRKQSLVGKILHR
jgi:hypothetical protein